MSSTTTESGQLSRLGITTPTPLPLRVGADNMTESWPGRARNLPRKRPIRMLGPDDGLFEAINPARTTSDGVAKRASPCKARRGLAAAISAPGNTTSSPMPDKAVAASNCLRSAASLA